MKQSIKDSKIQTKDSRLLVICVDRDNDIGDKANIETPAVGRDACIEAAQRLALEDPEDADSNSIFAAIKMYEDLVSQGYKAEVVTVAGSADRGVAADEKIIKEVKYTIEKFPATGVIVVSDGEDDESVIPIIQGVVPVVSVKRVVMKVSRSVEYSYAVFGKYLKMIAYDPKYSKFFLGLPGILLLIGGIGSVFGYTAEIFAVLVSIFGGALLVRAFDVDKTLYKWTRPTPSGFIRLFMLVGGIILILSSIPAGLTALDPIVLSGGTDIISAITDKEILGQFVAGALPILWVGIGVIFAGTLLGNMVGSNRAHTIDILRLAVLASLYPIVYQFTNIVLHDETSFTLIPPLLAGLAATLTIAALLFWRKRKHKDETESQP
ncbi:MAG: DUF373 family protein [Cenarchaeum sp. SB0663_bin_5]|nr:DUF373 family protein [Cenarchaeum sp. SB0663_bin_5]MYH04277.1 DUF373 family protein [Cenarchaeum sp. SB0675_bin_21]